LSALTPKVAKRASGEHDGNPQEIECYEQLRSRALAGGHETHKLGLALLHRRGLAAWARALEGMAAVPGVKEMGPVGAEPSDGGEIVCALASMALACLEG
jgi:hypothetical protein